MNKKKIHFSLSLLTMLHNWIGWYIAKFSSVKSPILAHRQANKGATKKNRLKSLHCNIYCVPFQPWTSNKFRYLKLLENAPSARDYQLEIYECEYCVEIAVFSLKFYSGTYIFLTFKSQMKKPNQLKNAFIQFIMMKNYDKFSFNLFLYLKWCWQRVLLENWTFISFYLMVNKSYYFAALTTEFIIAGTQLFFVLFIFENEIYIIFTIEAFVSFDIILALGDSFQLAISEGNPFLLLKENPILFTKVHFFN